MLTPKFALVLYKQEDYSSDYYIEQHSIRKNGTLGPPAPVTMQLINSLVEGFSNQTQIQLSTLSNQLFFFTRNKKNCFAWWIEKGKQELLFDSEMEIYSGEFPMPYLVFLKTEGNDIFIFATKEKPTLTSKLYIAPLPNNSDWSAGYSSGFCFGAAKWKEETDAELTRKSIEGAVFSSMFTERRDNIASKDYKKFYNELLEKDEFPLTNLKKSKCTTLKTWLANATR